jgi:L-threonylcarbamoyladenylate synthase
MEEPELIKAIKQGKIFIYPTATIYGLGCNAENPESVKRIKEMKGRDKDKPLSVIAPSIKWIKDNLIIDCEINNYLPGPFTLILKKKNPEFLKWVSPTTSLGVRIPANNLTKIIQKAGKPFITTSVNLSGEPFATSLEEIPKEIKSKVDFIIEADGELSGKPSTLIINGKIKER